MHVLASTSSLLEDGDFDIQNNIVQVLPVTVSTDRRGRVFTHWNLGTTLIHVPFQLGGTVVAQLAQAVGAAVPLDYAREFAASFLSPLFGALTTVAFYAIGRTLSVPARPAAATALTALFASLLWPYSKSAYLEIVQTFFLTAGTLFLLRWAERRSSDGRNALAAGVSLGALLLLKVAFAVLVPVLVAYPLFRRFRELPGPALRRSAAAFVVPPVLAALATLAFNAARFGNPFETGYSEPWSLNVLAGIHFQLLSPQQGLFLYSPIVALSVLSVSAIPRERRAPVLWLLAVVLVHLALYGVHQLLRVNGWGPRYLVPVVPLLLVPLFFLFERFGRMRRLARIGVVAVSAASVAVQLIPFFNPFDQYHVLEAELRSTPTPPAEGRLPPVTVLPRLLAPKLVGRPAVYDAAAFGGPPGLRIDHTRYPGLRALNFWFVYAADALGTAIPYSVALLGILAAAWAALRLFGALRTT